MRKFLLLAVALASCSGLKPLPDPDAPAVTNSVIPVRWQDISAAPFSWTAPLVSSFADTLRPGVVVYWVPDSTLPQASISWVWPEGQLALTPAQGSAADLLGELLRRGGAGELSGTQVDDTLEYLAANASISVGMVRTTASVSGLSRDLPFLVDLLTRMVVSPRFDTARLDVLEAEALQDMEHRFDTPAQTSGLSWDRIVYGRGPWTVLGDSSEVAALRKADIQNALRGRFRTDRLWIAVAGRFDRAALRTQLLAQLDALDRSPWRGAPQGDILAVPAPSASAPQGVYVYDIPASQVQIRMGTRFVRRDHPDYYPLMLACQVLGQGFGSRLVDRIRSDEGLAYHVGAWAGSDYDREATLGVSLQTKVASTGRALFLVDEEIRRLTDSGFRAGELDRARQGLIASVPTLFDTPENTAGLLIQAGSWGRRDDHFRQYAHAIDSIPDSVVLATFRRWFRPDSMRIVISGPYDSLVHPFADGSPAIGHWGPVHRLGMGDLLRRAPLDFETP